MDHLLLANSPAPVVDAAWVILLVSRVLHVACAGVILGGLVYLRQVVAPLAKGTEDCDEALYRGQRSAWAKLVMLCTVLLLLSGFFNLYNIMAGTEDLHFVYHMLFGIKFLLAMFVFFVAAGTAGASPLAINMRKSLHKWLSMALVAALLIFILGATLRSFEKTPRNINELAPAASSDSDENSSDTAGTDADADTGE